MFVSSNLIIVHVELVTMFSEKYKNNCFSCNTIKKLLVFSNVNTAYFSVSIPSY